METIVINDEKYLNPNYKYEGEEWKDIIGYEGLYQISNYGRVKSLKRIKTSIYKRYGKIIIVDKTINEKIMKSQTNSMGYYFILLSNIDKLYRKTTKIHRLVGLHFIPNKNNNTQLNHIDGVKSNNSMWNLEWCDASYNQLHAIKIGLKKIRFGEESNSKFKESDIQKMFELSKKMTKKDIAKIYNVGSSTICMILSGKNWKNFVPNTNPC